MRQTDIDRVGESRQRQMEKRRTRRNGKGKENRWRKTVGIKKEMARERKKREKWREQGREDGSKQK